MFHRLRFTLIGCCASLAIAAASTAVMADQVVSKSVKIGTRNYSADWYLPSQPAKGLVYLQHGFQRNKSHLRELGNSLMSQGLMVVTVSASMTGGASSMAPQVATMLANRSMTPPTGYTLPSNYVLAGHSAGGLHVTLVGADLVNRNDSAFRGVVLFDPVDANNRMTAATNSIANSGRGVYAILANAGSCNSSNNAQPILRDLSPAFVGFKLTNRSAHTDAEGGSSDFFGRLFCGTPQAENSAVLQAFAAGWAIDMLQQTSSPDFYPGGVLLQQLIAEDRAELLKAL